MGLDITGMTDAEQAAYWKASRDRMAAQAMEQAAKLEQARKALENIAQRANESGAGELALLVTIHAMHAIARAALSLARGA